MLIEAAQAHLICETNSALIVVDMQVDFCAVDGYIASLGLDPAPCRDVVPELKLLIDGARRCEVPVLWAFANYQDDLVPESMRRRKKDAGVTRSCCVPGNPGFNSFGVKPLDGESQFIKHSYSVFTNPAFEAHLRANAIDTLIFSGVQTNVCVDSTLRDAFNRGFHVVVAQDCVASHSPALHDATLQNVRALLGYVESSAGILDAWQKNHQRQ